MNTFNVKISVADQNGSPLDGIPQADRINGKTFDFSRFVSDIDGFDFAEVRYFGKPVSSMSFVSYGAKSARIEFSDGTYTLISGNHSNIQLELVYRNNCGFYILDSTVSDGRFYAVWNGEQPENVTYKWYRRIYGTDDPWEEVTAVNCTENQYNLPVRQEIYSFVHDSSQNWINTV